MRAVLYTLLYRFTCINSNQTVLLCTYDYKVLFVFRFRSHAPRPRGHRVCNHYSAFRQCFGRRMLADSQKNGLVQTRRWGGTAPSKPLAVLLKEVVGSERGSLAGAILMEPRIRNPRKPSEENSEMYSFIFPISKRLYARVGTLPEVEFIGTHVFLQEEMASLHVYAIDGCRHDALKMVPYIFAVFLHVECGSMM